MSLIGLSGFTADMQTAHVPKSIPPASTLTPHAQCEGSNVTPATPPALWLRDKQVVAIYSISRTKLWGLAKRGRIRSVALQEPGMDWGTRLFCKQSIDDYIASFLPENQDTNGEEAV